MKSRKFSVKGLGEVAIRCADIDRMFDFYHQVIGLAVENDSRQTSGIVFFRIGEKQSGVGGHTTVLALFKHDADMRAVHPKSDGMPNTGAQSSLHHLALTIEASEHDDVIAHYDRLGLDYRIEHFGWIGWRGIFTTDPEGNTIELVAHNTEWMNK